MPMLERPSHNLPSQLDIRDPDFANQCVALLDQMRCEMYELVAVTNNGIVTSRILLAEIDRVLARR
jgi:hypothetical protein